MPMQCKSSRPGAWIEDVAQTVAEEVKGEDGDQEGDAGRQAQPRFVSQVARALADHLAPGRRRRLDAETDEAEARLQADRRGGPEAGQHHQLSCYVGEDVDAEDAATADAERSRRLNELLLFERQSRPVGETGETRRDRQADGDD